MKTLEYKETQKYLIPHPIRSTMIPVFCRLELPQPSYHSIKTLVKCVFALWISACAITYIRFSQIGSHIPIQLELLGWIKYVMWQTAGKIR